MTRKRNYTERLGALPLQAWVRQQFDYNPETGEIRHARSTTSKSATVGALAGRVNPGRGFTTRFMNKDVPMHRIAWLHLHGEIPAYHDVLMLERLDGYKAFRASNLKLATIQAARQHHRRGSANPNHRHGKAESAPRKSLRRAAARFNTEEMQAIERADIFNSLLNQVRHHD